MEISFPIKTISQGVRVDVDDALPDGLKEEFVQLFSFSNGFSAFEGALIFYPFGERKNLDVPAFNHQLDKINLGVFSELEGAILFAEDAFGFPFGIIENQFLRFDIDSGQPELMQPKSLSDWFDTVANDYDYWTGWSLMNSYQLKHNELPLSHRLNAIVPFVLGGQFEFANLFAAKRSEIWDSRKHIREQISNFPEGSQISVSVVD